MPFLGKNPGNAVIADASVTSVKILDATIATVDIANDAVTAAKIADDAVDEARLQISNAGSNGQVLSKESGNTGGLTWITSGGLYSAWTIQTATLGSSEAAASGDQIICNHASTAIVITLPASPSNGDTVIIKNVGAATVTVGRAGNNINSVAADATMPVGNAAQLVFTGDATIGWTVL